MNTETNNHNSHKYFLIAFGLFNILAFTLLLCGLGFLLGLTISKWQFPLGCLSALVVNYYASRFFMGEKAMAFFLKSSGAILCSVIALILFSGLFYDVSFDGQWYHQETIHQLKQGYNPVYQNLPVPANETFTGGNVCEDVWCTGIDKPIPHSAKPAAAPLNLKFLAINHFSKGSEILEAAVYKLTSRIETGKAINFILLLASFFLCLSLLYKINQISIRKKWLLAVLLSFNPIVVVQLFSFCVDGNLACLLLGLIAVSCLIFIEGNRYSLFLLIAIAVLTINIKYTGLIYTGMFGAGFLVALLIYKKTSTFKKVLIAGLLSFSIGIVCCGFNPYVTNIVQKHTMFYGLDETRVVEQELTPTLLKNLNRFEKLFLSLSTHEGAYAADKRAIWHIPKIPFYFNKQDIYEAYDAEQMLSGFGPFFSGVLLIAGFLFIIALVRFRKTQAFKYGVAVSLIILSTVLIIPDAWWARFVPQLWLLPVVFLVMGEFIPFRSVRFLRGGLYLSLGVSVAWALFSVFFNVLTTAGINYQLQQLKALNKPINIEYCNCKGFRSNQVRFFEAGIPITEKSLTSPYVYRIAQSNTRFETSAPLPDLPKSFLLRLSEQVSGGK